MQEYRLEFSAEAKLHAPPMPPRLEQRIGAQTLVPNAVIDSAETRARLMREPASAKATDSRGSFVDSMVEGAFAPDGDSECVFIRRMSRDERDGAAYHWPHARRIAT